MTEQAIGYDGNGINVGDRVELHPGIDLWMQGARYGTVVSIVPTPRDKVRVRLDKLRCRCHSGAATSVFSGPGEWFRFID